MRKYVIALAWLLVVTNLVFWAWSRGDLRIWGWGPTDPREPQRVEQQLRPEAVRLLESNLNR
jgi:hypothetical protein